MSLRVLYATPFWQERSGPEESLLALLRTPAFGAEIDPVVALPSRSPYVARFADAGVPTVAYEADLLQRTVNPRAVLRWGRRVAGARAEALDLAHAIRPAIAHSNMETTFGLALAARSSGVPAVHHVRSISFRNPRPAGAALLLAVRCLSEAQIAISGAVADLFPAGARPAVVENPVAPDVYGCRAGRAEGAAPLRVLALGRVSPRKHLELFVDIAAGVTQPATFRVVGPVEPGDADYAARLRARAAALGLADRLEFSGPRPASEALASADVLLNVGGNEGFCRVVAEAMAAGLAVVAKDEGATRLLVGHGRTGMLFSDLAGAITAVDALLGSRALRESLAGAARQEADRRFSGETAARAVLRVYDAVMARA